MFTMRLMYGFPLSLHLYATGDQWGDAGGIIGCGRGQKGHGAGNVLGLGDAAEGGLLREELTMVCVASRVGASCSLSAAAI